VPLEYGNVDHVAVGPEGALAVETKWSGSEWLRADVTMRDAHRGTESVFIEHSPGEIGLRLVTGFVAGLLGIVIAAGLLAALNWWAFGVNAALVAGGAAVGWTSAACG